MHTYIRTCCIEANECAAEIAEMTLAFSLCMQMVAEIITSDTTSNSSLQIWPDVQSAICFEAFKFMRICSRSELVLKTHDVITQVGLDLLTN